jgi:hypothetical protein
MRLVKLFPFLVLVFAVLVGLARHYKEYALSIPKYGWLVYAVLGGHIPPWMDKDMYQSPVFEQWIKPGDVIAASCGKCGTTWLLQTLHQIRTKGKDVKYEDLCHRVPFPEFKYYPGQTIEERITFTQFGDRYSPRVFKSHLGPLHIPFRKDLKYVVGVRNPVHAVRSLLPFFNAHEDAFFHLFGDMPHFSGNMSEYQYFMLVDNGSGQPMINYMLINLVRGFWPYRKRFGNVLVLRYEDRLKDAKADVKRLAEFLELELSEEDVIRVTEHSNDKWMKAHEDVFEMRKVYELLAKNNKVAKDFPGVLKPNSFIKSDKVQDLPKDFQEAIIAFCQRKLGKPITDWLVHGGPIPEVELTAS